MHEIRLNPSPLEILLVDDDSEILAELREGLLHIGLEAVSAGSAAAALGLADDHPDLKVIVTDINMPRIDGIELLQKLSLRRKANPMMAIVISGYATLDRAVSALRLHAVDFLQKPVSAQEVAHAVQRALSLVKDGDQKTKAPTAEGYLRALVALRSDRSALFRADLFSDPAWDMVLDLALAEATGRAISVTSLCLASGAPTSTALRRIDDLQEAGLVERFPDTRDRRRIMVRLTAAGTERMQGFIERQLKRLGEESARRRAR